MDKTKYVVDIEAAVNMNMNIDHSCKYVRANVMSKYERGKFRRSNTYEEHESTLYKWKKQLI